MKKILGALGIAGALVVAMTGPALAHVSVYPVTPPHHGFATIAFRVPNERPDTATVKLEVTLPVTPAITSASTQPVPGWTAAVTKDGDRVASIAWTGGRIGPREFQEFPVSIGGLPDESGPLTFKALQTYDDGEVVRWIEEQVPGGDEAEHPAPVLELAGAAPHDAATPDTTDAATEGGDSAPVAAYAVSAAALALSVVALRQSRRTSG